MKCPICKKGDTAPGTTTVTLQREGLTLIVKAVPAQVCDNCGEAFVDEKVTAQLLDNVESEARDGSEVNVRHFQAA
jgi:YgiT-type zinc finger domain-containing protein